MRRVESTGSDSRGTPSLGSPGAVGAQSQADRQEHADAARAQDLDGQPAEVASHEKEADGAPAADTAEALTPAMGTSAMLLLATLLAARAAPPLPIHTHDQRTPRDDVEPRAHVHARACVHACPVGVRGPARAARARSAGRGRGSPASRAATRVSASRGKGVWLMRGAAQLRVAAWPRGRVRSVRSVRSARAVWVVRARDGARASRSWPCCASLRNSLARPASSSPLGFGFGKRNRCISCTAASRLERCETPAERKAALTSPRRQTSRSSTTPGGGWRMHAFGGDGRGGGNVSGAGCALTLL